MQSSRPADAISRNLQEQAGQEVKEFAADALDTMDAADAGVTSRAGFQGIACQGPVRDRPKGGAPHAAHQLPYPEKIEEHQAPCAQPTPLEATDRRSLDLLLNWISRQAHISGDARNDILRLARRHGWTMQLFGQMICDEPVRHNELRNICTPFERAVLGQAWRSDFGAPSARQSEVPRRGMAHTKDMQHYIGGGGPMYELDAYDPKR
eukprot:TRINITY_DN9604_c0_g1_i1.p1 TRINITY_DN9604_c0_g1~~TRINITY_DN9604_c0_g1_i1.p1  ORF type:complete len:208 (-),score=23.83 TRINITY_DN9604_c0_g1_i1:350-973(-)